MFDAGWVGEVRHLVSTVPDTAPAWNAAGYGAVRDVVRAAATVAEARERVIIETRQYAKRQRTWLRHQLGDASVLRIDPHDQNAPARVEQWWEGGTT